MNYSIVIPTIRPVYYLKALMESIAQQTVAPSQIIVVREYHGRAPDFYRYQRILKSFLPSYLQERLEIIATPHISDFKNYQGVSYNRNQGIKTSKSTYTLLIDDDNILSPEFASHYLFQSTKNPDAIFFPVMQRPDGRIQSVGYEDFDRRLGSPAISRFSSHQKNSGLHRIRCCATNALRGPTEMFQSSLMDESFRFVYEDIEWTYRLSKKYDLFADYDMPIVHHEAVKNPLQKLYISTLTNAYRKAFNRIIFVKKHATPYQKRMYRCCGFWLSTGWLVAHILRFAPWNQKMPLLSALFTGTMDAFKNDTV